MSIVDSNSSSGNASASKAANQVSYAVSESNRKIETTAAKVANTVHLPTLPHVASQLLEFAQQDEPDFCAMAKVIRLDPAISGRLLTTVNSALFGFTTKVDSVEKAIPKLGMSLIRTLILGFHLGTFKSSHSKVEKFVPKLWRNFLTQAVLAESISQQTHLDEAKCFLAGMVQDIGMLALISEYPEEYTEHILEHSRLPNVLAAENSFFGFNHIDVTIEIVRKWNIGDDLVDSLRHHHDRFIERTNEGLSAHPLHAVLQASHMGAGILLGNGSVGMPDQCQLENWHSFLSDHFGYEFEDSNEILKEVGARVEAMSVMFGVDTGQRIDSQRIASKATTLLQSIAMEALTSKALPSDEIHFDYLSGLRNRRFLNEVLKGTIAEWVRKRKSLAMLFIDVDEFKAVNDVHGHRVGDELIRHISSWFKTATRESDFALRLGGDEFLIVAQIKRAHLEKICERLIEKAPPLVTEDGTSIPVWLSVGCIFYEPCRNDDVDPNWIIDQADQLMYDTKREGGQAVRILHIDGKTRKK